MGLAELIKHMLKTCSVDLHDRSTPDGPSLYLSTVKRYSHFQVKGPTAKFITLSTLPNNIDQTLVARTVRALHKY